jgi:hypothetical protein
MLLVTFTTFYIFHFLLTWTNTKTWSSSVEHNLNVSKEQTSCVSETGTVPYVLNVFSILAHSPTEVKSAEDLSPGLDCQLVLVAPGTLQQGMLSDTYSLLKVRYS